jgi:perosamine synthetase
MATRDFTERERRMSARSYAGNELDYVQQALACGQLSSLAGGTFVPRFERAFAEAVGVRHAVAVSSCMSALHAALLSLGVGAGTEVVCDSEFIFGAMAAMYANAVPVFVDIDPVTHNMRPELLEAAITSRTKAVIVTHAWGLPAEIDRIVEIAHRHGVMVVEDCAQALMATYRGRPTGGWGDIGCFSFQASKQLSLGDGGMATTDSDELAAALGLHGGAPTFLSVAHGLHYNYRMNEPTAAIGLAQVESLSASMEQIARGARRFDAAVEGCDWLRLQRGPEQARHSFYYWVATFEGDPLGLDLNTFRQALADADIASVSIGYTGTPSYRHPVIRDRLAHAFHCADSQASAPAYPDGLCPIAERVIPRLILGYPIGPEDAVRHEADLLHDLVCRLDRG